MEILPLVVVPLSVLLSQPYSAIKAKFDEEDYFPSLWSWKWK
jgi:hypothetical protein